MYSLIKQLVKSSQSGFDTIVFLGIGSGSELSAIVGLSPEKIVAVESSEVLFASLKRKANKLENVQAMNRWVLPAGCSQSKAYLFTNPRFNSLSKPLGIVDTYPNIRLQKKADVKGVGIDSLFDNIELKSNKMNVLVMSLQGSERSFVESLSDKQISAFDYIVIKTPPEGSYETGWSEQFSIDNYIPLSFDKSETVNEYLYMRISELALVKDKLFSSRCEIKNLKESLAVKDEKNIKLSEQEKAAKISVNSLSKAVNQKEEEKENLLKELEVASQLNKKLNNLDRNRGDKVKELEEKVNSLISEKEELVVELNANEAEFIQLKQVYETLVEKEKTAIKSLELNAKLMTKLQDDFENLRERYREKVEVERELRQLIDELYEKLKQAALFYHQLEEQYPEFIQGNGKL